MQGTTTYKNYIFISSVLFLSFFLSLNENTYRASSCFSVWLINKIEKKKRFKRQRLYTSNESAVNGCATFLVSNV